MKKLSLRNQRGQTIVIIAVAMIALLIFAAFAVDLGYVFFQRRTTQNAADAAALAAARKMGLTFSAPTGGAMSLDDVQGIIDDFAARNAGQQATLLYVLSDGTRQDAGGTTYVPSDAVGMEVKASNTFGSWFARLLGYNQLGASADACAAFSAVKELREVAPIGVSQAYKGASGSAEVNLSTALVGEIGALNLACEDPSTCGAPSTSDIVSWTKDGYPGAVSVPAETGGGLEITAWGDITLQPGDVVILPVFDTVTHFQYGDCDDVIDPDTGDPLGLDPDGNPLEGCVQGEPELVLQDYSVVRGEGLPYYSFNITSFAAFQVSATGWPNGRFISYAVNGAGGNETNNGAIVVKLNCLEDVELPGIRPPTAVKTDVDGYEVTYTDFSEGSGGESVIYEFATQSPRKFAISHIDFYFDGIVTVVNAFYRSYDPDTGFLGEPIVSDYEVKTVDGVTMVKFDDEFGDGEYRVLSIEVANPDGTLDRCAYPKTVFIKAARYYDPYEVVYDVDGYDSGCE